MVIQETLEVQTRGRETREITGEVNRIVSATTFNHGICHVFVHHTSASLILCENADPVVRDDLETFMSRIAPDGGSHVPAYRRGSG